METKSKRMIEAAISLIIGTILLLGSPGPAPLALAATSATFGIRSGIPFFLGNLAGITFALVAAAVGLTALFSAFPSMKIVLQIIGGLYICYIAFKIATAPTSISERTSNIAPKFRDGVMLNILNPKGYAAFLAIFSQFLIPISPIFMAFFVTGSICFIVTATADFGWLFFGNLLGPLLRQPRQARVIRIGFGILMVTAVIWVFAQ
jgi:threonine/homoserine/homoserine lactone efflux protein